jgi:rare lipoprotein A
MNVEQTSPFLGHQRFFRGRSSSLLRATAIRTTLAASIFGLCGHAVAGDHGQKPANPAPNEPKLSTAGRLKVWFQTGQASWYGLKFQGRKTATGEIYDMNALTCAHRSLPLGSWIRVTNLRNSKTVLVRVNDRGPSVSKRIIDLSYAAARAVGLYGTGKVKLERVSLNDPEIAKMLMATVIDSTLPRLSPLGPEWSSAQ